MGYLFIPLSLLAEIEFTNFNITFYNPFYSFRLLLNKH